MRLAIFDLDGTVLRGNSWRAYFWRTLRRRPGCAPGLLWALALRAAGRIEGRRLREAALKPWRGLDERAMRTMGVTLIEERLRADIRPAARRELARCAAEGDERVLATGAFDFIAEPLAAELGIRHVICTRLEYDQAGRFTGRIRGMETRGVAKAEAVRAHFATATVEWTESCAFSDDLEDAPLFALVGRPVLVTDGVASIEGAPPELVIADWSGRD